MYPKHWRLWIQGSDIAFPKGTFSEKLSERKSFFSQWLLQKIVETI